MYICSVDNVPTALNHVRVAVVLEALRSHKKYDSAAEEAGILFTLLARSVHTNCSLCLDYLLFSQLFVLFFVLY